METSGEICSVALARGEKIWGIRETHVANSHAAMAAVFVYELLQERQLQTKDLDAVCVSAGPGSYTGLRIGAALAKGICYAANLPLLDISTLEAMAAWVVTQQQQPDMLYCPVIDARRMEVYAALFDARLHLLMPEQPLILHEDIFAQFDKSKMIVFGSGAEKLKKHFPEVTAISFSMSATCLIRPALRQMAAGRFADIAYFEPRYLKPFYSPASSGLVNN